MTDAKTWYQSITIWGAVIAAVAGVLNACGVTVSDAEQRSLAELLTHLGEGFGLGLVIWGRIRARHTLTTGAAGTSGAAALLVAIGGAVSLLTLPACSEGTLRQPTPAEALLTACEGWQRTLTSLAAFRAAGQLSPAQIETVDHWRPILSAPCSQPPADDAVASTVLPSVERGLAVTLGVQTEVAAHSSTAQGDAR